MHIKALGKASDCALGGAGVSAFAAAEIAMMQNASEGIVVAFMMPDEKRVKSKTGHVPFGYLKVRFSMMPEKWFGVL